LRVPHDPHHGSAISSNKAKPKKAGPVLMALVYSGTITLVLVAGGLALMQVLTAVINHPLTNFVLAFLLGFFASSLLGWYDITLPSWLQDATASGESRGGLMGVFFMALTFSMVSFAGVGPVLWQFPRLWKRQRQSSYANEGCCRRGF
jgi:MFS family permease